MRSWRRVANDRGGNVWVEYLILIAVLGLGGYSLVNGFVSASGEKTGRSGQALIAMEGADSATGSSGFEPAVYTSDEAVVSPNIQLVSAETSEGGGGFGHWVSSFAGAIWDHKWQLLGGALTIAGGLLVMEAGAVVVGGGGVLVLSVVGAEVGIPAVAAGGFLISAGFVTALGGAAAFGDALGQALNEASSESAADSGSNAPTEQELKDRSKLGDVEATYELNKLKAKKAHDAGNDAAARGPETENEVLDDLGDQVQEAGRIVTYKLPDGTEISSEIDAETATDVIQVKSGRDAPSPKQAEATRQRAKEQGKKPKLIYDKSRMGNRTLKEFQKNNPDFEVEGRDFTH